MAQTAFFRFRPTSRFRLALAAFLLVTCVVVIWVLAVDVRRQIERQSSSKLDNVQWTLSQAEVELIHLVLATGAAQGGTGTLADVRLRYDLIYSRMATLREGSAFGGLRQVPDFVAGIGSLDGFIAKYLPLMDGPDEPLRQRLPALYADAMEQVAMTRQISVSGVKYFAGRTDRDRQDVEQTLNMAAGLTVIMVTTLVGLIFVLLHLDRNNRRNAALNLQTLSRLDAIVATAQEAIIAIDEQGRIVDFNGAATQTLGFDRAEAVGFDLAALISDPDAPQAVFSPGQPPAVWGPGLVRISARHKDGHAIPLELSMSQTLSGDAPLYVAFLRDMSVQLAAEQAMLAARDEALAGAKAKADLLVVMSHEIRTPLNGMIGTIDLLGHTALGTEQREYLRILQASGQLLMHHVNDVLDIARLDSGMAPYAASPVDLHALVQEVLENQSPSARGNGNVIRYDGPSEGSARVLADGALLRQVLLNLVGNAVKFTHGGQIVVRISCDAATGISEISVTDTGIGIAPADLDRIFDDFVTLDASYARNAAGTGLGLGIVRRIVGHMGGTLQVESTPGKGSLFRVILPLPILTADAAGLPALPAGPAQRAHLTTLVIEDNEFNRMIIRDMLRQEGHVVVEACDGLEGISLAAAQRFDLIFMDISMPKVDGLQAARAIAQGTGLSRDTPILAMTAHAMAEEAGRFRAAGMRDALIKPITRQALHRALALAERGAAPAVLVDVAVLQEMQVDLGQQRTGDLVARFLAETGQSVAALVARGQGPGLDQTGLGEIHRLEGSAAMFGANALRQALSQIQTLWKSGDPHQAQRGLPGLQTLWQQTSQAYCEIGFLPQLSSLR